MILAALPAAVTPPRLMKIGAAALVGCRWSPAWLPVFVAGIFLNWLGMALSGPAARRLSESDRKLDVIAQTNDLFSQALLIVIFG